MTAEEEDNHLKSVENALLQLLNDDIDEADKILKQQDSSYHHLGRGISSFIASMLGVEKELLKDAAQTLQAYAIFSLFPLLDFAVLGLPKSVSSSRLLPFIGNIILTRR